MLEWSTLVERGREVLNVPPLSRAEKTAKGPEDWKFRLGDLLLEADVSEDQLGALADALGNTVGAGRMQKSLLTTYMKVARAWPPEKRVATSWATHRLLSGNPDRFDLIGRGLTVRRAQELIGKAPSDDDHPSRWSVERRATSVLAWLMERDVEKLVRADLDEKRVSRRARAAVRLAGEERSAETRDAIRELREMREAKSPERAALEAVAKLRTHADYVRAVVRASVSDDAFLPAHRRADLLRALCDLAVVSVKATADVSENRWVRDRALRTIKKAFDAVLDEERGESDDDVLTIEGTVIEEGNDDTVSHVLPLS